LFNPLFTPLFCEAGGEAKYGNNKKEKMKEKGGNLTEDTKKWNGKMREKITKIVWLWKLVLK
jgi:hypothetical protein